MKKPSSNPKKRNKENNEKRERERKKKKNINQHPHEISLLFERENGHKVLFLLFFPLFRPFAIFFFFFDIKTNLKEKFHHTLASLIHNTHH